MTDESAFADIHKPGYTLPQLRLHIDLSHQTYWVFCRFRTGFLAEYSYDPNPALTERI